MKKINLISDFCNSSSDASNLEAIDQEIFEKNFQEWFDEKMKDFEFSSRFLMCHLGNSELYHPHFTAIVTNTLSVVSEGFKVSKYFLTLISSLNICNFSPSCLCLVR